MFIISPRIGLCNQLQTIVKGLLLSIKYNRNLYIDKFQIDLNSYRLTDINDILDIDEIQLFLSNVIKTPIKILKTLDINIINNFDKYYLPNIDYTKISDASYIIASYINDDIELNKNMEIIYLGSIVSLDIYTSFNYLWEDRSDNNLYFYIMNNLKFNKIFYELKNYIKQELKLNNFNCIHLRIEDDAILFFSTCYNLSVDEYNKKLIKFYDDNIKTISQDQKQIYICSGILDFDNKINLSYYENIMKNNTLLCDKRNIKLDNYYLNNRELIAIIDLLISFDSELFVGCAISSFTQVINTHHLSVHKPSIILS
jgi:hypothetical protein